MPTTYSENFEGQTTGAAVTGWTNHVGDTWLVTTTNPPSGTKAYAAGTTNGSAVAHSGATAVADMAVQLTAKVFTSGVNNGATSPIVRSNTSTGSFYRVIVFWSSSTAQFYNVNTNIGGTFSIPTYANGDNVIMKMEAEGTTLRFKIWKVGTTEPGSWTATTTDGAITAAGYGGAASFRNGVGNALFDDYYEGTPGTTFGVATTTVAANDAGIFYSKGFNVNSTRAITPNPGNYIVIPFSGTQLSANLNQGSGTTVVRYSMDNGDVTEVTLPIGTSILNIGSSLADTSHTARIWYVRRSTLGNSWGSSGVEPTESLSINSYNIDNGKTIGTYAARPKRMIVYGDSITEGYAAQTSVLNDAMNNWVPGLAAGLDAEYDNVGWSGQGYKQTGLGSVPALDTAYAFYFSGVSRFSAGILANQPDYLFDMHGVNGSGGTAFTAADVAAQLTAWRAIAPNARIFKVIPFGSQGASLITTGFNNYQSATPDTKMHLINLGSVIAAGLAQSGTPSYKAFDGLHPKLTYAPVLTGALVTAVQAYISGPGGITKISNNFNGGI